MQWYVHAVCSLRSGICSGNWVQSMCDMPHHSEGIRRRATADDEALRPDIPAAITYTASMQKAKTCSRRVGSRSCGAAFGSELLRVHETQMMRQLQSVMCRGASLAPKCSLAFSVTQVRVVACARARGCSSAGHVVVARLELPERH